GGTDGPCLDVARSVVVSCTPLAAAGGRVSPQEWWEAARGGSLHRRCTPTRPAVRASPGMKGPRGCHARPLVQAFLPLWRCTGEPAIFIRRGQVHGPTRRRRVKKNGGHAAQALGRSRGGLSTKSHAGCRDERTGVAIVLTAGHCHESPVFETVL